MWISGISTLNAGCTTREKMASKYLPSEEIVEIRQSLAVRASTSFFYLCNPSIAAGTAVDATSTLLKVRPPTGLDVYHHRIVNNRVSCLPDRAATLSQDIVVRSRTVYFQPAHNILWCQPFDKQANLQQQPTCPPVPPILRTRLSPSLLILRLSRPDELRR